MGLKWEENQREGTLIVVVQIAVPPRTITLIELLRSCSSGCNPKCLVGQQKSLVGTGELVGCPAWQGVVVAGTGHLGQIVTFVPGLGNYE